MAIMTRARSSARLAILLAAGAAILGCNSNVATVTGKITYRNKAVTSGEVLFLSQDGKAGAHAPVLPDGTYKATDVPVGTVKVGLQNPPPLHYEEVRNMPKGKIENNSELKEAAERAAHYVPTPEKYVDANKSGLSTAVKPGENTYDIDLR